MANAKNEMLAYVENISVIVWGITLFLFPLLFTSITTDAFTLPKQILFAAAVIISGVLFGVRMIMEGRIRLRTTPFDVPVLLMTVVVFISALLAPNRYDAIIAFFPILYVALSYFMMVNTTRTRNGQLILVSALIAGSSLAAILAILSFFKVYILPFPYTKTQLFTPFGSLLDQAMYFALMLPIAGYLAYPLVAGNSELTSREELLPIGANAKNDAKSYAFAAAFILLALGLSFTVYMLVAVQKPLLLPFETGFQTAMSEISRDTGRVLQGFLFGNGFGTYMNVFTRFKEASYNTNPTLWSFTFFRSSSFILELMATTGFLGLISFLFIVFRIIRERHYFLPLILAIVAAFILPFSFTMIATFFILLAFFAIGRAFQNPRSYGDLDFYLVALKQGLFAAHAEGEGRAPHEARYAKALPVLFSLVLLLILGAIGFYSTMFVLSDLTFQKSLVAAARNDGRQTYLLQGQAINQFPYRDAYYRIFSQTNLALANSLASAQPKGSSPSAQVQQNILTLIQQSINSGRQAVAVAPQTALNWNNLSSVYRALIGFGQNADQFAIATNQQAILLDPNNPQQYINLGGIFYQLQQWDQAQSQFLTAIDKKQDYANAYYNLGHALEAKGDYARAVSVYTIVKNLVAKEPDSVKKIQAEIDAVTQKAKEQGANQQQTQAQAPANNTENQPPLKVNEPTNQLPERNPKVSITPAPSTTPYPTPTGSKRTTLSPSPTPTR